jgi:acyl-CoA reductase-like NAD-dependent aldehyde dehydrogenase
VVPPLDSQGPAASEPPRSPDAPLIVLNPATGARLAEIPAATRGDVESASSRARAAQPAWAALPLSARALALRRLARAIRDDGRLTEILVAESGKPHYEAEGIEIFYTLELTRYYTGRGGRKSLADQIRRPFVFAYKRARVIHHPRGVVGVIAPWNWPLLNNYADCVAPLLAGNAVLLKPSEWTPLTSIRIAELWRELGLPADVFQVIPGRADVGQALCDLVDMVFFTGSGKAGRQVAARCGERLIPAVMELGGKSPLIVLADADLRGAARAAVWSAFAHSGQVCIRTERVLVEEPVAERFTELCRVQVESLRQGGARHPPQDDGVDVGAITFPPQVTRAQAHIADAVARGARVVCGGSARDDLPGTFFRPTVLAGVTTEMLVSGEETFGPVLPIITVRDAEEALRVANQSPLGLSGSIWTRDRARGRSLARRLQAGSVCINDVLMNYFVVEAPLGGVKGSGLGVRHGPEGLRQFCRLETVIEDHPLLRWISPIVAGWLMFPYRPRTLRLLRWLMRRVY